MSDLPPPVENKNTIPAESFKSVKVEARALKAKAKALRPWYRKKRFVIPVIFFGLPVFTGAISNLPFLGNNASLEKDLIATTTTVLTTSTTEPPVSWDSLLPVEVNAEEVVEKVCAALRKSQTSFVKTITERVELTDTAYGGYDAFISADFVAEFDWVDVNHVEIFTGELRAITDPILKEVPVATSFEEAQQSGFLQSSLDGCAIRDEFENVMTSAKALDGKLSVIKSRASNLPWYPKGFGEWESNSNVAWRWANKGEFRCSYGERCQAIYVTSKSGCLNGLYAKINILDSADVVVDYSNDLISGIRPGETAKLQFEFFTSGAGSTRLVELNCY
jgi:hypothetical protein